MAKADPNKRTTYYVTVSGWVAGLYRLEGSAVELTEAEAKYETGISTQKPGKKTAVKTGVKGGEKAG